MDRKGKNCRALKEYVSGSRDHQKKDLEGKNTTKKWRMLSPIEKLTADLRSIAH